MDFDETDLGTQLKDKNLFRQQCFIDGKWTDSVVVKPLMFITLLIYH